VSFTLHLGVIDVPYAFSSVNTTPVPKRAKGKAARGKALVKPATERKVQSGTETTGDVADWLETKYGVMAKFWELQGQVCADALGQSLVGYLQNQQLGAPAGSNPFAQGEDAIAQMFRQFLSDDEMAHAGVPGVPTQAALDGFNPRLKSKQGSPRPSFIATGLYQKSFRAWIE